jgi:sugar lactone lactonase YvrE
MVEIKLLIDAQNNLGEGPLWDVAEQKLYWIDSLDRWIYCCDADGRNVKKWAVPQDIGSMALREKGGAILALRNGFHAFDFATGIASLIVDPEPGLDRNRLNDGKVDRRGRFVAGSMDSREAEPLGALYRLDPDLTCHVLDRGIIASNAPCWSPDGRILYFADTLKRTISAYDYDLAAGAVSNKRLFASTAHDPGLPDGGTVDADGYVWSAQIVAGRLVRYAPDGKVDRIVEFPAAMLTSVMFGGSNLDILFVTTMGKLSVDSLEYLKRNPVPAGKSVMPGSPGVGGLFAAYGLGVKGLPEPRFVG